MQRRFFLASAATSVFVPHLVQAQTQTAANFHWENPGALKLTSSLKWVLASLVKDGLLTPQLAAALDAETQSGQGQTMFITSRFQATRMYFGNGLFMPNVVVDAKDMRLPAWQVAPKEVAVYSVEVKEGYQYRHYRLIRPVVCGNWSLQIFGTQGECIRDNLLCGPGCDEIRRAQRVS